MVAPSTPSTAKFLSGPPQAIRGILLYGTDRLQIAARAESLCSIYGKAGDIIRLHDQDLAGDSERLVGEISMRPLFGGEKVVWLTSLPAKAQTALMETLAGRPLRDLHLIVQAFDLKKSHKIVQMFEAAPDLAAIPCYGEDRASLPLTIKNHLAELGHSIDAESAGAIAARSNFSASIARRAAEKLSAFVGEGNPVTLQDVEDCLHDQQTADIYDVADAALDGDSTRVLALFERAMASGEGVTGILAATSQALRRLHGIAAAAASGSDVAQAVRDLKPPVFFRQRDTLMRHARMWTSQKLELPIRGLNAVTRDTRLKPDLAEALALNYLLAIARSAPHRTGQSR